MLYLCLKALHILSVVAWMAGLLMYPRLKIYQLKDEPGGKLFVEMQIAANRLRKIIMTPALVATWVFGLGMVAVNPGIVGGGTPVWFPLKFLLVIAMSGLHGWFVSTGRKIDAGTSAIQGKRLRAMNEVPFLLLVGIVLLVILKPF